MFFCCKQRELIMSKYTYSTTEAVGEDLVLGEVDVLQVHSVEKRHSSAPSGIFSLRRARYFNKARFDETGHGVRRSDLAEAAIAEVAGELQQAW
jgi:hypothetical protein